MGLIERSAYLEVGKLGLLCRIIYANGNAGTYFATKSHGYNTLMIAVEDGEVTETEAKIVREQIGATCMPNAHKEVETLVHAYNLARMTSDGDEDGTSNRLVAVLATQVSRN